MHYVLGFPHHLTFRDPQGGLGNSHGKIIDLNTIELPNGDLDWIANVQHDLSPMQQGNCLILQPPQGDIGFRQEIAGPAGGVQEFQSGQFPLKCLQFGLAGFLHRQSGDFLKFSF